MLPHFLKAGSCGVDLFFVISGFIMAIIAQPQFHKKNKISDFLFNRATRIYPLYWFYTLFCMAGIMLHRHQWQDIHPGIWQSFLLFPQSGLPILAVGWSLVHEMYFYCMMSFFLFFPEKYTLKLIAVWLFCLIIGNYFIENKSPFLMIVTHPLSLEFAIGYFVAKLTLSKSPQFSILLFLSGVLLLMAGMFVYLFPHELFHSYWSRIMMFGIPSGMIVYGAVSMENNELKFPKFLGALGDASYSIYLSHILVLLAFSQLWIRIPIQNLIFHISFLVGMVGAVILYGQFSYRFIEKPLILLFRRDYLPFRAMEDDESWPISG